MSRFNFTTEAEKYSQSYVDDKSSLGPTGIKYLGFFQPIDSDVNTVALGIMSQAYQYVTNGDAEIEETDYLLIRGKMYGVRGVRVNQMKRQNFTTCIMELTNKA